MAERHSRTAGKEFDGGGSNERVVVFEGETLSHSPQLAQRFAGWVSRRFE